MLANGGKQQVGWVSKQDGLLAMDLNGDGLINNSSELFGDHTRLADSTLAKDGWAALASQDSNADGVIDSNDANFDKLRLWVDADSDGVTDAGELFSLADQRIASINMNADSNSVQQNGNVVQAFSTFTTTDGATHEIADVGFQVKDNVSAQVVSLLNGESFDLSAAINASHIESIDMANDAAANTVKLSLNDVLGVATQNGVHQLTLTGDANDSAVVNLSDWLDSGITSVQGAHIYAVYNAANGSAAQLLIDQAMLTANHVS
jgi:hypothetical protein